MKALRILTALALVTGSAACTMNVSGPAGDNAPIEIEVRGGLEIDPGLAQGEAITEALTGLDGETRHIRFKLRGYPTAEGTEAWPLSAGESAIACAASGPVVMPGNQLDVIVQPYNHLLISIQNADAASLRCDRSGPTGTLVLEGRFAVAVEAIPTANAVTLTAQAD